MKASTPPLFAPSLRMRVTRFCGQLVRRACLGGREPRLRDALGDDLVFVGEIDVGDGVAQR